MEMHDQLLERITQWAELFFSPREICVLEELDFDEMELRFIDEQDPIYKAFQKGKLTTQANMRVKIKKLAMDGSPAAQLLLTKLMNQQ